MVVGYVLIGMIAGFCGAIIAVILGGTFWLALVAYVLTGLATIISLAARTYLSGRLTNPKGPIATSMELNDLALPIEFSVDQTAAKLERPMRILAVDDDSFILDLIPLITAKAGFNEVATAASGDEALLFLSNSDLRFDCLIFDISMPGMDGVELCRRVRQLRHYRQTPIIMLTAMRDMQNMGDAYRAGATDFVTKPFDIQSLGGRLKAVQEKAQAQRDASDGDLDYPAQADWQRHSRSGSDMHAKLTQKGIRNLVDFAAFSSYLDRLPHIEVPKVRVLAISISTTEKVDHGSSSPEYLALLVELATVVSAGFGVDRSVLAFTDSSTMLIATDSDCQLSALDLEIELADHLQTIISEEHPEQIDSRVDVAVGGPVTPQGAISNRAEVTTNLAITLMQNRLLSKQGKRFYSA